MLTALLASLALFATPPDLGPLLEDLSQTSARMESLAPRLSQVCTDRAEDLNDEGKPEHAFEETTRTEWVHGVQAKAILSASEDGQDVTAREQEKLAAAQDSGDSVRERGNYGGIDFSNPFTPEAQRLYAFSRLPAEPGDGALVRLHFAPRGEPTSRLNTGEALVDPRDGMPVEITAQPSDYPSFVDFVHFQARYQRTPVGPVQTGFSVEGAGGFLMVHKHYRETRRCSGFSLGELSWR